MALPAGVVQLGTFKGGKGDKGDTGSLAYATAETVSADQPATVTMVGPESNRGAHFEVPRGLPGVNAIENDAAVAAYVGAPDAATKRALLKNGLTGWLHVDGFGADPDGASDSTSAIQAALAAANPGDTIYFRRTGPGTGYVVTGDVIEITKPNIRIMAGPRDAYATSIRCSTPGSTIIKVKAPGS